MAVTLLRGFILVLLCFWLMPIMMGVPGIWLAVPAAETLTLLFVLTIYCRGRKRKEKLENYLLRKPKIKRHGKIR